MLNFSFVFTTPQLKFQKSKFIFSAVIRNDNPNIICNHITKLQNSFFSLRKNRRIAPPKDIVALESLKLCMSEKAKH